MDDRRGATCVHVVTQGLDEGDIVWYEPYQFNDECLVPADYESTQVSKDIESLHTLVDKFKQGVSLDPTKQDHVASTYFPRLETDTHGWIDWSQSVEDVIRAIRAFDRPYAGASTTLNGHDVRIRGAQIADDDFTFHPFQAGLIYRKLGERHFVACADRGISIDKIDLEASSADQKNSVRLGDRLFSPAVKLQAALEYRATYRP
jgi:methionyl-tRNA formyltransferase